MTRLQMESVRETITIRQYELPNSTATFTPAAKSYALRAAWDGWVHLVAGRYLEARENLQFAADMLGGAQ